MSAAPSLHPCARCGAALEHGDFRCPVCALTLPEERAAPAQTQIKLVRCDACGAAMDFVALARAPSCAFCGSVTHLEVPADPPEQAQAYLPFRVDKERARQALEGFLKKKAFFRPSNLAQNATLDSLQPLYWPGWVFSAKAKVSWTADSEVGAGRSAWAPHSGQVQMSFDDALVSASRGLSPKECEGLAEGYQLSSALPDPQEPQGCQHERFDVARSGARAAVQAALERQALAKVTSHHVPGSKRRKVSVAIRLERLSTRRLQFPSWVLAYRYEKKLYRVVVHGQDPQLVLGKAPVSVYKVIAVTAAGLLAAAALVAALLLFGS